MNIGKSLFDTRKPNKLRQAKVKAGNAMRRLAKLTAKTEVANAAELFHIRNCTKLNDSIDEITETSPDGGVGKAGLKIALGNLVKLRAKILITKYRLAEEPQKANETKEFLQVFSSPTFYAKEFGRAEYQLDEKGQKERRKPSKLPLETDLDQLTTYMKCKMINITATEESDITSKYYISLRKVTLAFVTLTNAR